MRITVMLVTAVVAVLLVCGQAWSFDIVPAIAANDEIVKGWVGFGDPNGGLVGPYAAWNSVDPTNVWGAGVRGQVDLSGPARALFGAMFGVPETWWNSLESVGARAYVFHEIGACDLTGQAEAVASPGLGARFFVLTAELTYDIFEGGKVQRPGGDILAESGFAWFIGISRVFRF